MKNHTLLVAFVNDATSEYLAVKSNGEGPCMMPMEELVANPIEANHALWEIRCVTHNLSASEVGIVTGVAGMALAFPLGLAGGALSAGLAGAYAAFGTATAGAAVTVVSIASRLGKGSDLAATAVGLVMDGAKALMVA